MRPLSRDELSNVKGGIVDGSEPFSQHQITEGPDPVGITEDPDPITQQ